MNGLQSFFRPDFITPDLPGLRHLLPQQTLISIVNRTQIFPALSERCKRGEL